jgi:hypothetical protein
MDPPKFLTHRPSTRLQDDSVPNPLLKDGTGVQNAFNGDFLDQVVERSWEADDVSAYGVEQQGVPSNRLPYGVYGAPSPGYRPVMAAVQPPPVWETQAPSERMSWQPNFFPGATSYGVVNPIGKIAWEL